MKKAIKTVVTAAALLMASQASAILIIGSPASAQATHQGGSTVRAD